MIASATSALGAATIRNGGDTVLFTDRTGAASCSSGLGWPIMTATLAYASASTADRQGER